MYGLTMIKECLLKIFNNLQKSVPITVNSLNYVVDLNLFLKNNFKHLLLSKFQECLIKIIKSIFQDNSYWINIFQLLKF